VNIDISQDKHQNHEPVSTTWVYDDECGWIDVELFLVRLRKIEEELSGRLKKTG